MQSNSSVFLSYIRKLTQAHSGKNVYVLVPWDTVIDNLPKYLRYLTVPAVIVETASGRPNPKVRKGTPKFLDKP